MIFSSRLLLVLGFVSTLTAHAAPRFTAPVRYDFNQQMTTVTLQAGMIKNDSRENATGSLKVQLWACSSPYEGGTIHGQLIGTTGRLEALGPAQYFENLKQTVAYTPPSVRENYCLVFVLLEYKNGNYVIVDHVNLAATKSLGPLQLFTMEGPWRWQTSYEGGTVDMSVAKISHTRTGTTGSLKLSVWVTAQPYRGGRLVGYEIGQVRKDPLKAGFVYTDVKNTAKFVPPPAGTYYPTLVLSESDGNQFITVAYLSSSVPAKFTPPR